jgi:hypothetical protein
MDNKNLLIKNKEMKKKLKKNIREVKDPDLSNNSKEDGNETSLPMKRGRSQLQEEEEDYQVKRPRLDFELERKFKIISLNYKYPDVDGVEEVISSPTSVKPSLDSAEARIEYFVSPVGHVMCESATVDLSFVGRGDGSFKIRATVSRPEDLTGDWSIVVQSVGLPDRLAAHLHSITISDKNEVLTGPQGKYSADVVEEVIGEVLDEMLKEEVRKNLPNSAGQLLQRIPTKQSGVLLVEESEGADGSKEDDESREEDGVDDKDSQEDWSGFKKEDGLEVAKSIREELSKHFKEKKEFDFFDETLENKERKKIERRVGTMPKIWNIPVNPPSTTEAKRNSRDFERVVASRQREQILIARSIEAILFLASVGDAEKMFMMGASAIKMTAHLATGENLARIRAREGSEVEKNAKRPLGEPLLRKGQMERLKIRNEESKQLRSATSSFFRGGRRFQSRGFGGFRKTREEWARKPAQTSQWLPTRITGANWQTKCNQSSNPIRTYPTYTNSQQTVQQEQIAASKPDPPKGTYRAPFNRKK